MKKVDRNGVEKVGGEGWGSVLLLGRHLMVPNPQENKNKEKWKRIGLRSFLCGDQGGIPREQNRELTTT